MPAIQTRMLTNQPDDLALAADVLARGGLVALPTETVYGLGADATNDHAVAGIYAAKGRPSFNPLIVHVATAMDVPRLVHWPKTAARLAEAFWPGPLTLVLPLRPDAGVSRLVTAGLDTLAVRVPAHPVAQAVLAQFGGPVAAPSANRSGQISPTQAAHVRAGLAGRIDAIVDGGACQVGVESTIVGFDPVPTLLRPGGVSQDALEQVLGQPIATRETNAAISAPGQMTSHYAPDASVRLNATTWRPGEVRLGFGDVDCDLNLSPSGDLLEAAANLFAHLHALDARNAATIAVSPIPDYGLGVAINDRLQRAAAPRD